MSNNAFLSELAIRFGTPAYVYDVAAVRSASRGLREDLPVGTRLLYSVKANPHPLILEAIFSEGIGGEVSSVGEIAAAMAAGCRPTDLLHTGPGKSSRDVDYSLASGIRNFSIESATDRSRLAEAAVRAGVYCEFIVRLNGPAGSTSGSLRMTGVPSGFGVDTADLGALTRLFEPIGPARPIGTHTYFATNIAEEDALLAEFEQALRTVVAVCDYAGYSPRVVDLGGGFPAPSSRGGVLPRHPALAGRLGVMLDRYVPRWRNGTIDVVFEAGRSVVATAGTLLTQILDVKQTKGRTFTVVDAGVNALGGMSGLGRLMAPDAKPYQLGLDPENDPGEKSDKMMTTTLMGPLCTPLDVLNREASLSGVQPGHVLAIPNVGAYGLTASLLGFLSHPMPVEIVHDSGEVLSARRLSLQSTEIL